MKRRICAAVLLLALAWERPADASVKTSATQTVSPAVAAKLRHLLPFPEVSLAPKMELTMGLDYTTGLDFTPRLFRSSSDYAAQIVAVRRTLTGGSADASRYRRLGVLYRRAGLLAKSKVAFGRSEALEKAVLRRQPANGPALAGYGLTLQALGQTDAAAAFLRQATKTAPNSADVWLALGWILDEDATPQTEATKHFARDAGAAFDRAISLAPQNPTGWAMRASFRTWDLPQVQGKFLSRDGLSDYEHAAALSPHDPYMQAQVPTIDCFTFELAHHIFTSPKAAKMEPPASDRRAEIYLRRITSIAQSTHGRDSAAAYTARAWVQFEFFYDPKGAQKSLRLALRHNPRQQDAIDYQMHVAAVVGDYPLLAAACRRELRVHPVLRLRLLLAEADYFLALQKPLYRQEARTQMELAHTAEPKDYAISLGLAVLLLKSGRAADQSRAAGLLERMAAQVPQRPKPQQTEYELTCGISSALAGDVLSARQYLTRVLQNDPQCQSAKSALALLPH